jgi:hypothetical protein
VLVCFLFDQKFFFFKNTWKLFFLYMLTKDPLRKKIWHFLRHFFSFGRNIKKHFFCENFRYNFFFFDYKLTLIILFFFFSIHQVRLARMPRRYCSFNDEFLVLNIFSNLRLIITLIRTLYFIIRVVESIRHLHFNLQFERIEYVYSRPIIIHTHIEIPYSY